MKNIFSFFILITLFTSCKKTIENIQEDIVVNAMTDGQWRVTKFTKGSTDITTNFSTYKFQFLKNNTVQAINNGSVENTGSWSADANARTIASNFSNTTAIIINLNGTWKITNNSWTFVEATQTVNSEVLTLRLDK